jgi:tRNA pseudouridine55 synthase
MSTAEGLLNIDKPGGMTSHDVVNRIRRLAGIRRVGHAGTLDPLATGVLLLCLGRATRLVEYLVGLPKTYEAVIRLGQETDTYDAAGEVVAERPYHLITADQLQQALTPFRGPILQTPPIYSAIKQKGQPLYKLARAGAAVKIPARKVTIYELEALTFEPPEIFLRVVCSSGTYIRSLAHDLGQTLDCGGHITTLRRTAVGDFKVREAVPLAELANDNLEDFLLPSDTAVAHFPRLDLTADQTTRLQQGQRPVRHSDQMAKPLTRAYNPDGHFVGMVSAQEDRLQARKMFL